MRPVQFGETNSRIYGKSRQRGAFRKSETLNIEGRTLSLVAAGEAQFRHELADATGPSRSTVAERLAALIAGKLVEQIAKPAQTHGRPSRMPKPNKHFAAADIGEPHAHVARTNLRPTVLAKPRKRRHPPRA